MNKQRVGRSRLNDTARFEANLKKRFGNNYVNAILSPRDYNGYIDNIKSYVEKNKDKISTSQLRNIFSKVKEVKEPRNLTMLRPKLAYVVGRQTGMKELVYLLDELIKKVNKDNLNQFKDFFEAIIAYHRYFNPTSN